MALGIRAGILAFLNRSPLIIVVKMRRGATDGLRGAAGGAVIGVGGDEGVRSVLDFHEPIPGVPF